METCYGSAVVLSIFKGIKLFCARVDFPLSFVCVLESFRC